jgi:hypothetical protein
MEVHRLFSFAIEPQEWSDLLHLVFAPHRPAGLNEGYQ